MKLQQTVPALTAILLFSVNSLTAQEVQQDDYFLARANFDLPQEQFSPGAANYNAIGRQDPDFWVVNFGTARTLKHKKFGFAAGMGGQMVFLGDPKKTSAFFTIPHAGFRYGISKKTDIGLRLAPIPLPFSTVGPGFGVNLDGKFCLTKPESKTDFALVLGLGGAHVLIEEVSRFAYSPNFALLNSYKLNESTYFTIMGRYVHLAITTAPQGAKANFVNISGMSFGLKKDIRPTIAILPEVGAYWYQGKIIGVSKNGLGLQYGLMISTSF